MARGVDVCCVLCVACVLCGVCCVVCLVSCVLSIVSCVLTLYLCCFLYTKSLVGWWEMCYGSLVVDGVNAMFV